MYTKLERGIGAQYSITYHALKLISNTRCDRVKLACAHTHMLLVPTSSEEKQKKKININGIEAKLMWEPKCLSLSSVDEVIVYRFPHFI